MPAVVGGGRRGQKNTPGAKPGVVPLFGRYSLFREIRRDALLQIIVRRDRLVFLARALDDGVLVGLAEERDRVARAEIFVGPRHAHAVQRRQQLIVAPAHQHVADVAGDGAGQGLDVGPGQFRLVRFLARAELQAALAGALVQQRQAVEVGVGAGAPAGEVLRLGVFHRQIVQQPQRALVFAATAGRGSR